MKIIEVRNLTHRFSNGVLGLVDVSLTIEAGEFVVIAGPNGSGKTTFLRHLNGLLLPESGTVVVDGVEVSKNIARSRRVVGMVFQDTDSQIVGETVYDDVAFGPENLCLKRAEIEETVKEALMVVGLQDLAAQSPHLLSGGEKRRLAIAGILAMKPKVAALDEPFSSLDYPGVRQVLRQILSLHENGNTIVLATHDLEKVIAHADRLVIMEKGRVAADGPPGQIVQQAEHYGIRAPCATRLGVELQSWLN